MSVPSINQELDPTPMVDALLEKSQIGKMTWEATAREGTFVSTIGGLTLKIALEPQESFNVYGNPDQSDAPVLFLVDGDGKIIWQIYSGQTRGLWRLYRLAQRVANRVDDRIAGLMESLQKL